MAILLPQGKQAYENGAGQPLAGGKVWTYDAGTTTPRNTWSDAAQTALNSNPVILDARGEASIYWLGAYKVALTDSADVPIWTVDPVSSIITGPVTATTLTTSGQSTLASPVVTASIGPSALQQHSLPVVASDTIALLAASQTLLNKTLTAPVIASISNGGFVQTVPSAASDTLVARNTIDTLTNKTITALRTASTVNQSGDAAAFTIGYRQVPQNAQSGNYPLVLTDDGKHIYSTNVGAQTITVPLNAAVAFALGAVVTIANNGTTAITISTVGTTVYQAGTANTGDRTLATRGLCTLLKVGTNTWFISGSGLS